MDLGKVVLSSGPFIPLLVLAVSLVGSPHCLIMCGAFTYKIPKASLWQYHLGRLLSYLTLAATFWGLYAVTYEWVLLQLLACVLLSVYFFFLIYKEHKSCGVVSAKTTSAFLRGLGNGVLPCSWLLVFLVSLQAVQNIYLYFLLVVIFWLGTVPIFYIKHTKFIMKWLGVLKPLQKKVLLIILFIFSLSIHLSSLRLDLKDVDTALMKCATFLDLR